MTIADDDTLEPLSASDERELSDALLAAWAPYDLDPSVNERLIEIALEDPLAPPTEEEIIESERLRRALDGEGDHPAAALAEALRAAAAPANLDELSAARLARAARDRQDGPVPTGRRSSVVLMAFGAGAAVAALAAAVALVVRPVTEPRATPTSADRAEFAATVAFSRSTASLFDERFELGKASSRVDRIAAVRERELRSNRWASWGVR